jgi:O-antigen ligase
MAIPATYFERLNTFENIEEDHSAMARIHFWILSYHQAVENPIFGIGLDNHQDYNEEMMPTLLGDEPNHVAHSVYFQVLAETGFVGLAIYLGLAFWTFGVLHGAYRTARRARKTRPDLAWVEPVAFWMRNGWAGYMFGSAFLNMLPIDFPWYFMWYAHILPWVLKRELKRVEPAPAPPPRPGAAGLNPAPAPV